MPDYGSPGYWNERYAVSDGQVFDWYQDYSALRPFLGPFLTKEEVCNAPNPRSPSLRLNLEPQPGPKPDPTP